MTICSFSARRRYFDRSSLISDSAICFIAFSMFFEPGVGFGFRHDCQDLDRLLGHVVEDSNVVSDSKTVLWPGEPSQSLGAALARLGRLMPQMLFDRVAHRGPDIRLEIVQVLYRFRSQYNIVAHSGYILARLRFETIGRTHSCLAGSSLQYLTSQELRPRPLQRACRQTPQAK